MRSRDVEAKGGSASRMNKRTSEGTFTKALITLAGALDSASELRAGKGQWPEKI